MFLTEEFENDLKSKYQNIVKELVEKELSKLDKSLEGIVKEYVSSKLEKFVEEALKNILIVTEKPFINEDEETS